MNLTPNPTIILLQVLPFLATLVVLKMVVLEPLLAYLLTREAKTTGLQQRVKELHETAAQAEVKYQESAAALRAETSDLRARVLQGASVEEQKILADTRAELEVSVGAFRTEMAQEIAAARAELLPRRRALAGQIATTILGRAVVNDGATGGQA